MYITEVAIEGFKSYAQRVVLPNFDPTFNAITGLNGTGKSNILDSICFVLGIKNLSQVRRNRHASGLALHGECRRVSHTCKHLHYPLLILVPT